MAKGDIRANIGARTKGTQMQWGKTGDKGVHKGRGAQDQRGIRAKAHIDKRQRDTRENGCKGKEETRAKRKQGHRGDNAKRGVPTTRAKREQLQAQGQRGIRAMGHK